MYTVSQPNPHAGAPDGEKHRGLPLKSIEDQVVVVVGASSGIGREVARQFANRGAKVVAAARSKPGLVSLVEDIRGQGGEAVYAVCDVTDVTDVEGVAETAVRTYGRIDTWINVAAVSVYASFEDTSVEEFRRVMNVNFLGQVYGAKAALPHLRREGRGALIAISSVEGVVSLPLHSAYAASKHAVEGAFDALRRELMADRVPISVTSIKPATINTPFFNNSLSKLGVKPKGPPPIYEPAVVAACALFAAEHPARELFAGGAGKLMVVNQTLAPRMMDAVLARFGIPLQHTDEPKSPDDTAFYAPRPNDNRIQGDFGTLARRFSLFTWLETHPTQRRLLSGSMLGGMVLWRQRRNRSAG
jgi:NAD(P)-dependent dehydrogenase (short-subunit alcohol dehydrogenase family)